MTVMTTTTTTTTTAAAAAADANVVTMTELLPHQQFLYPPRVSVCVLLLNSLIILAGISSLIRSTCT